MSCIHPQDQLMIHKQRHSELQAEAAAYRAISHRPRPVLGLFSRVAREIVGPKSEALPNLMHQARSLIMRPQDNAATHR